MGQQIDTHSLSESSAECVRPNKVNGENIFNSTPVAKVNMLFS